MPQNQQTGAAGSDYGHECGKEMIAALGGKKLNNRSNAFLLDGKQYTVHFARERTISVGFTYLVLKNLDAVLGAFSKMTAHAAFSNCPPSNSETTCTRHEARVPLLEE
jgi:hypothetical protein